MSGGDLGDQSLQGIDLFLNFVEAADGSFNGSLHFNEAIFDRVSAERFLTLCTSLLRGAVTAPDAAIVLRGPVAATSSVVARRVVARRVCWMHHGNEAFSPWEIEDCMRRNHTAVLDVIAFVAPHRELGEAVCVAVVLRPGYTVSSSSHAAYHAHAPPSPDVGTAKSGPR